MVLCPYSCLRLLQARRSQASQKGLRVCFMMARYQAAWHLINDCVVELTGWYEKGNTCGSMALQVLVDSSRST